MKQTYEQKTNLVVIFVMLVLTVIGYSMTRMMATKQKLVPVTAQSSSAFYVAEGGINYAGRAHWPTSLRILAMETST
jgi:Tfp pilus assembly protein PilX